MKDAETLITVCGLCLGDLEIMPVGDDDRWHVCRSCKAVEQKTIQITASEWLGAQ